MACQGQGERLGREREEESGQGEREEEERRHGTARAWERGQGERERGGEGPGPRRPSHGWEPHWSRPNSMPATSPGLGGGRRPPLAPGERPMGDRAWERGGEGQGKPSPGWEPNQLLHWSRPGVVPAALLGLGGDRRPPLAPGEHSVTVRPASDDRSCHRHNNGIAALAEERKRKREKEREREEEEGRNGGWL